LRSRDICRDCRIIVTARPRSVAARANSQGDAHDRRGEGAAQQIDIDQPSRIVDTLRVADAVSCSVTLSPVPWKASGAEYLDAALCQSGEAHEESS
jgi:hypothetical protein